MNKIPYYRILKTNFVINYIELLDRQFYNLQKDLLFSKRMNYIDKTKIIYKRSIINDNINIGYDIIKNDILRDEVSYNDMMDYIKNNSAIIRRNYDKTLLEKYREIYNIDINEFTDKIMLDKPET